jgi:hypothetical protein
MKNAKEMPTGVKIISVLEYIGAGILAIMGLVLIFGGGAIASMLPIFGALGGALFIVAGIVTIGFGVLAFFIARGLWRGQNWARIVAIVFACLGVLYALISIGRMPGQSVVSIIIDGVIGGYLWFAKEVKAAFA